MVLADQAEHSVAVFGLRDDVEVGGVGEEALEAFAEDGVVVGEQDAVARQGFHQRRGAGRKVGTCTVSRVPAPGAACRDRRPPMARAYRRARVRP